MIRSWLLHRERWQLAALALATWVVVGVVMAVWYELIGWWRRWRAYRKVRGQFMVDRVKSVELPYDMLSPSQRIVRSELHNQEKHWEATARRRRRFVNRDGKAACLIVVMLGVAFVTLFLVRAVTQLTIIKCVVIGIIYAVCVLIIDLCLDRRRALKDHLFIGREWK